MATQRYDIFSLGLDAVMNKSLDLMSFNTQEEPTNVGAMAMTIPSSARAENITSGELPQIIFYAKRSFTDTTNGFRQGFDPTDGLYKWIIGSSSNSVDWNVTASNVLTVQGAISASTIDIGGADASSFHVDIDGNMWLGAATFNIATNPFAVSNAGVIRAVSGTIGGWTLAATTLTGGNATIDSAGDFTLGTGDNVVRISATDGTYRIWAGNATAASAPFSVTQAGVVRCSNAAEVTLTVPVAGNVAGITITQNDTNNNPVGLVLTQNTTGDIVTIFDGATEVFTILDGGNVGINQAAPGVRLEIQDANVLITNSASNVRILTSDAQGIDIGGSLGLGGTYNAAGNQIAFANISGRKENATDNNALGYFAISVRDGVGTNERMRISSAGVVTIGGTFDLDSTFDIDSGTGANALDSTATTSDAFTITGSSLTTGDLLRVYSNSADTNIRYLLEVTNDNALATGAVNIFLQQDGGNAHVRFTGDPANSSPTDGDLTYTGSALNFYDGTRTRDLLSLWEQIGETTLGAAASTITVSGFAARLSLRIEIYIVGDSADTQVHMTFNNDTAANYLYAISLNNVETQTGSDTKIGLRTIDTNLNTGVIGSFHVSNRAASQKVLTGSMYFATLNRDQTLGGSWTNATDQITRVDVTTGAAATFSIGSRVSVYAKKD